MYTWLVEYEQLSVMEESSGKRRIDYFLDLPSKTDYPDYYVVVEAPICLKQIKTKIHRDQYRSLQQFQRDIAMMCSNYELYYGVSRQSDSHAEILKVHISRTQSQRMKRY